MIDLQYLYYLPFCQVFVSDDRVHKMLATGLMRRNQIFVLGRALKADIERIMGERDGLAQDDPRRQEYTYGGFPPQPEGSIVQLAWDRCMAPGGFGEDS
jgi:hypothetical protein